MTSFRVEQGFKPQPEDSSVRVLALVLALTGWFCAGLAVLLTVPEVVSRREG
jgi:hypothetical protein